MYNYKLLVSLISGLVVVIALGLLTYFKGEAILFAITNETQIMAEKGRWNAHIESYGQVVEVGKE
jgi:hypothetical protein